MKKSLLSLFLVFSCAALLRADLTVVQHIEGGGQSGETTTRIKGQKVRIDIQGQTSVIMDTATGDATTLMHPQKSYMEMKGEMMKQMMGATADQMKMEAGAKPEALGKTEEVDGHKTELYSLNLKMGNETIETTYWVAKDFPNGDKYKAAMKSLEDSSLGAVMKNAPQMSELPGIPVKSVSKVPSVGTITTKLLSIKDEALDDAVFEKPTDYQALTMPTLPTPPAPAQ